MATRGWKTSEIPDTVDDTVDAARLTAHAPGKKPPERNKVTHVSDAPVTAEGKARGRAGMSVGKSLDSANLSGLHRCEVPEHNSRNVVRGRGNRTVSVHTPRQCPRAPPLGAPHVR